MTPVPDPVDYLTLRLPPGLARVRMPIVEATPSALEGYGCLIDDPNDRRVEIVRWPATGRRPVDAGTGDQGLYIHPHVWHEGVFGLSGTQRFFDKQGAVHARVSVDFAREFGCLLEAAIPQ